MITVKLTCPGWPVQRQTPGQKGIWGNCRFLCNTEGGRCDYWFVIEGLAGKTDQAVCPRENLVFITAEPPTLRTYKQVFINQFAAVITCHDKMDHPNKIVGHGCLPWHVGRRQKDHANIAFSKDYDELKAIRHIDKTAQMSVVVSSKDDSRGHRQRLDFARQLKEYFGDRIDLFGRGINEIEDKWDALAPYKYHVAIENSAVADYWTEKLSDAFLAGCHPVYYGCPNIDTYFPQGALTPIDITKPDEAVNIIEMCLSTERYEQSRDLIRESRRLVLDKHNMFATIADYVNTDIRQSGEKKAPGTIKLKKEPSDSNLLYRLKKTFAP